MSNKVAFEKIENVLNEEIQAYEKMSEFYNQKRLALISGTSDELLNVDSLILNQINELSAINEKRKEEFSKLGVNIEKMSDLIELTKETDEEYCQKFKEQKITIINLAIKLTSQEQINIELLKHGVNMVNKTIQLIVTGAAKNTTNYDKNGKNNEKMPEFSSIIEEV